MLDSCQGSALRSRALRRTWSALLPRHSDARDRPVLDVGLPLRLRSGQGKREVGHIHPLAQNQRAGWKQQSRRSAVTADALKFAQSRNDSPVLIERDDLIGLVLRYPEQAA